MSKLSVKMIEGRLSWEAVLLNELNVLGLLIFQISASSIVFTGNVVFFTYGIKSTVICTNK